MKNIICGGAVIKFLIFLLFPLSQQLPFHITQNYQLGPHTSQRAFYGDDGYGVMSTRNCGGPGQMVHWRYEKCSTGGHEGPCVDGRDTTSSSEFVFIPSEDSSSLRVRLTVSSDYGDSAAYENRLYSEEPMVAGREYAIRASVKPDWRLRGNQYTGRMDIFRDDEDEVELCTQADFYMS